MGPGKQAGDVFISTGGATFGITGDHKKVFGRLDACHNNISGRNRLWPSGLQYNARHMQITWPSISLTVSHCALAFLSAGGNSPKYAKSMLFEGTKMLGALTLSFFHRSRYTGKTDLWRRAPLLGLGRKSRRTHSLKGIVPEVAAHVSVLLGLHIISDGLTSFQTDSNTHQQVSGQGSCCPCCAIGPLTSSPAASRASSSLVS